MTGVVPMEKLSPGWCDWVIVGVMPELSVAVGSTQVTLIEVIPNGIMMVRGSEQPFTRGGVVSSPIAILIEGRKHMEK